MLGWWCFCKQDFESTDHIIIHHKRVSGLWSLIFIVFLWPWVLTSLVRDVLPGRQAQGGVADNPFVFILDHLETVLVELCLQKQNFLYAHALLCRQKALATELEQLHAGLISEPGRKLWCSVIIWWSWKQLIFLCDILCIAWVCVNLVKECSCLFLLSFPLCCLCTLFCIWIAPYNTVAMSSLSTGVLEKYSHWVGYHLYRDLGEKKVIKVGKERRRWRKFGKFRDCKLRSLRGI